MSLQLPFCSGPVHTVNGPFMRLKLLAGGAALGRPAGKARCRSSFQRLASVRWEYSQWMDAVRTILYWCLSRVDAVCARPRIIT